MFGSSACWCAQNPPGKTKRKTRVVTASSSVFGGPIFMYIKCRCKHKSASSETFHNTLAHISHIWCNVCVCVCLSRVRASDKCFDIWSDIPTTIPRSTFKCSISPHNPVFLGHKTCIKAKVTHQQPTTATRLHILHSNVPIYQTAQRRAAWRSPPPPRRNRRVMVGARCRLDTLRLSGRFGSGGFLFYCCCCC